jgi:hypothetical protein
MTASSGCKVDRVISEYDLAESDPRHDSIHDGLLARWQGRGGHAESGYRTLSAWFNKRLLRRVYTEHGRDISGGRLDSDYEVLTGEDDLLREDLLESLRADGIDAAAVESSLVSYGTMRTHLLECLDGEKETGAATDWERESIERARAFAGEKVESAASALASKGELDGFEAASVQVQFHLQCSECPTRIPLDTALDRGYVCERHGRKTTEE